MKRLYSVCYEQANAGPWTATFGIQVVADSKEDAKRIVEQRSNFQNINIWSVKDMGPYPMSDYPDNEE